jgi:hypothetical protein
MPQLSGNEPILGLNIDYLSSSEVSFQLGNLKKT